HNPVTAWIILITSLVLTVGAYFLSASFVQKRVEDRFSFRTTEIESAIKDRLQIYEQALWGGVGLMNASQSVSRQEWAKYVETLEINHHWPGIQGIGFSIPVQPAEKQAHIGNIRADGFPEYLIKPEGTRDLYSAIIYLEPFDWRNQRAFGYDMWSNEMRRKAMTYARDEGVAATSGIITLVQETKEDIQRGFLMYLPVYQTKTIPKTLQEKRERFEGWVYAPFRAGDLMKGIAGTKDLNIEFEIFDGETMSQETLLFDSNSELHLNRSQPNQGFQKTVRITLQGRLWTLYFSTPDTFLENSEMNLPRLVALAGGFVDLLLFYVIYSLYFINKRAEKIAKEMTQELRNATQELRNANDELTLINTNLKKTTVSRDYMDCILQSMTDTLIVIGSDATIQTTNQATLNLLGYEESELVEKPIKWVITEEDQKLDLFSGTGVEKLIEKGSVQGIEMTYTAKEGQQIPMLFSSSVMEDKEGTFKGIVCVAQDITERKQAEDQIKASLKEKGTLIDEIHHRVKNNMAIIASLLKMQANSIENEQVKEVLKESQNRVYAMSAIQETLHGSENLSEIDLKTYLSKVASSIFETYSVTQDKVKLNTDIEEIAISIDQANPVGLVVNELISNSLKYAFPDERKGEISVTLKKLDKELELIVMDDGIGIPEGLDWKNSKSLGLKLVRTLVENQLDGSIVMECKNGTKFIIKFNLKT
ncbi:MAG: CHASE domain-containing protein, partial [SAR324 cluster bacterium]|nr:CHASE domain-containing protein [SAR324 cluster bacterium]